MACNLDTKSCRDIEGAGKRFQKATGITYNTGRPSCRYFVLTRELAMWPHAVAYWGAEAVGEAESLASASDGINFSFERDDHVSCEAIYGTVALDEMMEQLLNSARGSLSALLQLYLKR